MERNSFLFMPEALRSAHHMAVDGGSRKPLEPGDEGWRRYVTHFKYRGQKIPERIYEGRRNLWEECLDDKIAVLHSTILRETGFDLPWEDASHVLFSVAATRERKERLEYLTPTELYAMYPGLSEYFDRVLDPLNAFVGDADVSTTTVAKFNSGE